MTTDSIDYEVGFGRPPTHTRFKKGQSGNPSGKKRPHVPIAERFEQILTEAIALTSGDATLRTTRKGAILRQLVNKALGGDLPALRQVFNLIDRLDKIEKKYGKRGREAPVSIIISGPDVNL